jgi:hypothetical protein
MWMRETPNGLEINIEGVMEELDKRKAHSHKRIKKLREEPVQIDSQESNDALVLKAGGQYFKLVAVKESSNIEDLLKEDYEKQLTAEKERFAAEAKASIDEFRQYAEHTLNESQQEISKLQSRLRSAAPMPEINYAHAKAGLSVVKGDQGRLIWLFNTVYSPQFVDNVPLSPAIVKKMVTPMVIMIQTKGEDVVAVETKTLGLDAFRHYHRHGSASNQRSPSTDCWGAWKWSGRKFRTVEDILQIGKEASSVLANINSHSLASRNPAGLPKWPTIETHIMRSPGVGGLAPIEPPEFNPGQIRSGVEQVAERRGGWTARTTTATRTPRR